MTTTNTNLTTFTTTNGTTFSISGTRFFRQDPNSRKIRISEDEFNRQLEIYNLVMAAEETEQKLDDAAENPEVTLEQFEDMIVAVEESETTEETKEITPELEPAVLNENGLVECKECPIKGICIHYAAMRRNPENVGGLGLCPRLKVKAEEPKVEEPKAKKERKPRKSKDIAWAGNGVNAPHTVTLTTKQVDFIQHLPDTYFWEDGLDSVIWVDCLCDDIQGQFAGKPMTVGAMISTLCEKGLGCRAVNHRDGHKCTSFALTDLGKKVAAELGLQ